MKIVNDLELSEIVNNKKFLKLKQAFLDNIKSSNIDNYIKDLKISYHNKKINLKNKSDEQIKKLTNHLNISIKNKSTFYKKIMLLLKNKIND